MISTYSNEELRTIGVRSSICHREKSTLGMLGLEVLIRKLLAIDRLAARALRRELRLAGARISPGNTTTDISTSKVTTLGHESRNHAVESRASIAEALFTCCKGAEVGRGLGDDVIIKFEHYATPIFHCMVLVSLK